MNEKLIIIAGHCHVSNVSCVVDKQLNYQNSRMSFESIRTKRELIVLLTDYLNACSYNSKCVGRFDIKFSEMLDGKVIKESSQVIIIHNAWDLHLFIRFINQNTPRTQFLDYASLATSPAKISFALRKPIVVFSNQSIKERRLKRGEVATISEDGIAAAFISNLNNLCCGW